MIRTLPPSGSPIQAGDLFACLGSANDALAKLGRAVCRTLGVKHAFFLANGRGAMTLLLTSLAQKRNRPDKKYVVVPSYTCYSVAASVLKAGLEIIVCDIDPHTLTYDREQLSSIDFDPVLAIVSANLYGIPDDLEWLESAAERHGIYLVDDAAQALGAQVDERPVGSFGTAGILSFDKGKVITSINGGVIVTDDDDLASRIERSLALVPAQDSMGRIREYVKAVVYSAFLHPWAYWIPRGMPFLKLGETRFDDKYRIEAYIARMASIANRQLDRLDESNDHRLACAEAYRAHLPAPDGLVAIAAPPNSRPVYLRFPIRIRSAASRSRILVSLRKLGVSKSYPESIANIPAVRDRVCVHNGQATAGAAVAREIITLPTHSFVGPSDIERIAGTIRDILGD